MACWSAENATNAYLKTMRMGKSGKEPTGAEFVSALAAGNNVQLTVVACSGPPDSTTLALATAAQQTGGRIICILRTIDDMIALGTNAGNVEFVIGDANELLTNAYKESDFVAIDCNIENHEAIITALQDEGKRRCNDKIVIGYNAFRNESWRKSRFGMQLLPIGEGLLITRIAAVKKSKGNWVVKVDKCTGEEHVFRVRSSSSSSSSSSVGRIIRA